MTAIPIGLCQCGCGGTTTIAKRRRHGCVKGQPCRFISGHDMRSSEPKDGYKWIPAGNGTVREHLVIATRALGHALPAAAEVHHVDGNGHNNANRNLVICQDRAYHLLLHMRARIVKAGGNPNTQLVCGSCHRPKDFSEFGRDRSSRDGLRRTCRLCGVIYAREYGRRKAALREASASAHTLTRQADAPQPQDGVR